jgi:hypothetical protein
MKKKLATMREFTLEMHEKIDCVHRFQEVVYKYAKFLGQKPTLGMFVPCDEEGNVLEEPKNFKEWCVKALNTTYDLDLSKYEIYQQALSRVVFEGFEWHAEFGNLWVVHFINYSNIKTLEDLTSYNLTVKFEI